MVTFVWALPLSGYNKPFWAAKHVLEGSLHGSQVVNTNVKMHWAVCQRLHILLCVRYTPITNKKYVCIQNLGLALKSSCMTFRVSFSCCSDLKEASSLLFILHIWNISKSYQLSCQKHLECVPFVQPSLLFSSASHHLSLNNEIALFLLMTAL